jgi:hypothetical protein
VSRIPRRRVRHAAAGLIILVAACARKDNAPPADSGTAAAAPRAATASRSATAARGPVFPGALAKPIDSYTGDELYAFTTQLVYAGSHERERDCKNASGCGGPKPTKKTKVQVSAVATQDSLAESNVPEFGVVYARAINKGADEEARYGFRADKNLRYYMIVQRDSAGGIHWRLEELDTAPPRHHTQVGAGRFTSCGHSWTPGARADFKTCDMPERSDTVVTMELRLLGGSSAPVWVGCAGGCCLFDG